MLLGLAISGSEFLPPILPFVGETGELLPLDEAAETMFPAAIVPTDGAN